MHVTYEVMLFLSTAAAAAVVTSPVAAAEGPTCTFVGSATQCVSPGNSQLTATTPPLLAQQPEVIIIHRRR